MTEQEIEKLREKLGSEYSVKRLNGAVAVELVDIWEGVEFAECVADVKVDMYGKEIRKGQIYPIVDWFKREVIYVDKDELGWQSKHFKPSTEADYVEQLKSKAHELYGEIKDGDRFDYSELYSGVCDETIDPMDEWTYYKYHDSLFTASESRGGILIYNQGKWAKKIERVNVEVTNLSSSRQAYSLCRFYNIQFKTSDISTPYNLSDISAHLAKCLEEYLNKKP